MNMGFEGFDGVIGLEKDENSEGIPFEFFPKELELMSLIYGKL